MEKETLEEQMYKASVSKAKIALWHDGFIAGAKYQSERMYSKEDMEEAFTNGLNRSFDSDFDRWLEQFKKK